VGACGRTPSTRTPRPSGSGEGVARGRVREGAALSLPALLEIVSKPLMEHIVPLQKLGVFGDLATKMLCRLAPERRSPIARRRSQSAWDSVDNRMGQLVYDNLFWNKTFKDLAMASSGPSGGTSARSASSVAASAISRKGEGRREGLVGRRAKLTHRAAYVIALPATVGMYGAASISTSARASCRPT
jgi:hypothetical protein